MSKFASNENTCADSGNFADEVDGLIRELDMDPEDVTKAVEEAEEPETLEEAMEDVEEEDAQVPSDAPPNALAVELDEQLKVILASTEGQKRIVRLAALQEWVKASAEKLGRLSHQSASDYADIRYTLTQLGITATYLKDKISEHAKRVKEEEQAAATSGYEPAGNLVACNGCFNTAGERGALVPVTNFVAVITVDELRDHGSGEKERWYTVKATRADGLELSEEIEAGEFLDASRWIKKFGSDLNVNNNFFKSVPYAIQCLSLSRSTVQKLDGIAHTGWVNANGEDVYAHDGGGIGKDGPVPLRVRLKWPLSRFRLPEPTLPIEELRAVVLKVYTILTIRKCGGTNSKGIAAVLLSMPWRAVLGACRFTVWFSGTTGKYKSSLASLIASFFMPGISTRPSVEQPAPAGWDSTRPYLYKMLHACKDVVLFIDNFIADGAKADFDQAKVNNILNSIGDGITKGKCDSQYGIGGVQEIRCSVASTGEVDPARQSASGRALLVEVGDSISLKKLNELQLLSEAGTFAAAMSHYIRHLAADRPAAIAKLKARVQELSQNNTFGHPRTASVIANLQAGFEQFNDWALEIGAINQELHDTALRQVEEGLTSLQAPQTKSQDEKNDGRKFLDAVSQLLAAKRVYLAAFNSRKAADRRWPRGAAGQCGWTPNYGPHGGPWLTGTAKMIGYYDAENKRVLLLDTLSVEVVRQEAVRDLQPHTVIGRLLNDKELLVEKDDGHLTKRSKAGRCFVLAREAIWPEFEEEQDDRPGAADTETKPTE